MRSHTGFWLATAAVVAVGCTGSAGGAGSWQPDDRFRLISETGQVLNGSGVLLFDKEGSPLEDTDLEAVDVGPQGRSVVQADGGVYLVDGDHVDFVADGRLLATTESLLALEDGGAVLVLTMAGAVQRTAAQCEDVRDAAWDRGGRVLAIACDGRLFVFDLDGSVLHEKSLGRGEIIGVTGWGEGFGVVVEDVAVMRLLRTPASPVAQSGELGVVPADAVAWSGGQDVEYLVVQLGGGLWGPVDLETGELTESSTGVTSIGQ